MSVAECAQSRQYTSARRARTLTEARNLIDNYLRRNVSLDASNERRSRRAKTSSPYAPIRAFMDFNVGRTPWGRLFSRVFVLPSIHFSQRNFRTNRNMNDTIIATMAAVVLTSGGTTLSFIARPRSVELVWGSLTFDCTLSLAAV